VNFTIHGDHEGRLQARLDVNEMVPMLTVEGEAISFEDLDQAPYQAAA